MEKTPLSDARLEANRANAQHSTGPVTPEGRARSSSNAVKHGLTARKVHLNPEDRESYEALQDSLLAELRPHGALELQVARNIVDAYWRLSRVRSIEEIMCTLTPPEAPTADDRPFDPFGNPFRQKPEPVNPRRIARPSPYPPAPPPDPDLLDAALVFLHKSQSFANITLYEQRIYRSIRTSMEDLRRLQSDRAALEKRDMPRALNFRRERLMRNLPFNPLEDGFVFSTEEIDRHFHLLQRSKEVDLARESGFRLEEFEKRLRPKAA